MRKILWAGISLVILSVLILASFADNAEAVPAFARKYKTSCMLCHALFPKLTAMGEAFRLNGYKLPEDDEIYVKEEPVSMGAEAYKKVFPNAVWPSTIPGPPPLSIRAVGEVNYHPYGKQTNRSDFNFPTEVSLLGAGAFGDDFSFYAQVEFEKEDDSTTTTPLGWLMWENLFSKLVGKHHLNIKAGNVGRQTIALPNTRNENSFTQEDYLYATVLDLDNEPGFQLNGFGRHWRYAFGVVETDNDNSDKDMYGSFALKFGGLGYNGSGGRSESGGVNTTPSGYWRDDSVNFGFFAYRTHLGINADTFDRIGGDVRLNYKDLSLAGGFIRGDNHQTNEDKRIWFGEAQYFLFPWMVPYLRYENLSVKNVGNENQARFVFGSGMLLRANIRANVEGKYYTKNSPAQVTEGDEKFDDQVGFQLDWAF